MKIRQSLAILAALLIVGEPGFAAAPQQILYQGTLRKSGTIYTGNSTFVFRVTNNDGTTQYWTSGSTVVAVNQGLFRYPLGVQNTGTDDGTFAAIPWAAINPYIEVTIDGTPLLPREAMTSVPYALFNLNIANVNKTGDSMTGQLTMAGSSITIVDTSSTDRFSLSVTTATDRSVFHLAVTTYGYVGIGITNPREKLHIQGGNVTIGTHPHAYAAGDLAATENLIVKGNVIIDGKFISHNATGSSVTFTNAGDFIVGTSTLVVTQGKVGIGTTNPATSLHVTGQSLIGAQSVPATTAVWYGNLPLDKNFGVTAIFSNDSAPGWTEIDNLSRASGNYAGSANVFGFVDSGGASQVLGFVGAESFDTADLTDSTAIGAFFGVARGTSNGIRVFANGDTGVGGNMPANQGLTGARLAIKNSGNVGIGTTTPLRILDANGSGVVRGVFDVAGGSMSVSGNGYIGGTFGVGTTNPAARLQVLDNTAGVAAAVQQNNASGFGLSVVPGVDTNYALAVFNTGGGSFRHQFFGSGNAYLGIGAGSVGVGTTSPLRTLDDNGSGVVRGVFDVAGGSMSVSGNGYFGGNVGINQTSPGAQLDVKSNAAAAGFALRVSSQDATAILNVLGNGYVGIGITNPGFPLTVGGPNTINGLAVLEKAILANGDLNEIVFLDKTGGTTMNSQLGGVVENFGGAAASGIAFLVTTAGGTSERARLAGSGNLGIGTTLPKTLLDVNGTSSLRGAETVVSSVTVIATAATDYSVLTSSSVQIASPGVLSIGFTVHTKAASNNQAQVCACGAGLVALSGGCKNTTTPQTLRNSYPSINTADGTAAGTIVPDATSVAHSWTCEWAAADANNQCTVTCARLAN